MVTTSLRFALSRRPFSTSVVGNDNCAKMGLVSGSTLSGDLLETVGTSFLRGTFVFNMKPFRTLLLLWGPLFKVLLFFAESGGFETLLVAVSLVVVFPVVTSNLFLDIFST